MCLYTRVDHLVFECAGVIPTELGRLTLLQNVSLYGNGFFGEEPHFALSCRRIGTRV